MISVKRSQRVTVVSATLVPVACVPTGFMLTEVFSCGDSISRDASSWVVRHGGKKLIGKRRSCMICNKHEANIVNIEPNPKWDGEKPNASGILTLSCGHKRFFNQELNPELALGTPLFCYS